MKSQVEACLRPGMSRLSYFLAWLLLNLPNAISLVLTLKEMEAKLKGTNENSFVCNFRGTKLRAVTGISVPYFVPEEQYEKKAIYYGDSQTYDITNLKNKGILMEVMESLALGCNFTFEIHIRKDKKFGNVLEYDNGTISSSGLFQSILDPNGMFLILGAERVKRERADVILASY